jgi:thiol-disulfide isomerase/thioredoxin
MIKKNIILMAVLILALIGFFAIYFTSPFDDEDEYKDGMQIPSEACLEMSKISFLYKAGCVPCEKMRPIIESIEEENNLSVKYYNILVPEENNELQELGLLEYLVEERAPVLIVDCRAYFGVKSESEYQRLILGVEGQ